MHAGNSATFLLITAGVFCAQSLGPAQQAAQAHTAATHTFSSEMGFELTYPAEWVVNQPGPLLAANQMSLDKESESDPYRRSIECAQNIFSARLGEPRSTFLGGAITAECIGATPDIDIFSRRILSNLTHQYQMTGLQFGAFAVQGQKFWILRGSGAEHQHPEQTETIEYLATVLPRGLVYFSARSLNKRAQLGFEQAHLRLASGVETDLIPAGALDAKQTPEEDIARLGAATISGELVPFDTRAPHHLDISGGLSYEVPPDLKIFNTAKWEASLAGNAGGQVPPHPCYQHLLIATPEDNSKQIIVTTYAQKCLNFSTKADNLNFLIANDTMNLAKKYDLRNPVYGAFKAGAHSFALMRTAASLKERAWEADRHLAIVLTSIPDGYAEFFLMGRTQAALNAMMATTLKLDDGAETALAPASAFSKGSQAAVSGAARTASTVTDTGAAQHFNSGLGFSLDLPRDIPVRNLAQVEEDVKAIAAGQVLTSREQTSIRCAHILLTAAPSDLSRMLAVTTHKQECIGFPLNADTLETMGDSAIVELAKRYDFSHLLSTRLTSGEHRLWAMRADMVPRDPTDPHRFFAVLLIPVNQGVAECMMEANTETDLDALMAVPLTFDDGTESALIPAGAFAGSH